MRFSVTERGTFERCKRQAILASKNGEHLTLLSGPLHFIVGTLVHRSHQLWLDKPTTNLREHTLNASLETQASVKANYKKQVGVAPSDTEMLTTYEAVELALAMSDNYELKYGTPLPPEYEFISAEQKVAVPVPGTEHVCYMCNGTGLIPDPATLGGRTCPECYFVGPNECLHYLEGRLDALARHKPSGCMCIVEHKTYAQRPREEVLRANDQFMSYEYIVSRLGLSEPACAMTLYDGMWKRASAPRGRIFDDLFARYEIRHSVAEYNEFAAFLPQQLNDMYHLYRNPSTARKTVPWNGCWDCRFFDTKEGHVRLCTAMSRGDQALVDDLKRTVYTKRIDDIDPVEEETTE